jgi:hypothetical protein
MTFTSRDIAVQSVTLPTDRLSVLRRNIQNSLGRLGNRWVYFNAQYIPEEQLALIVGELVVAEWSAEVCDYPISWIEKWFRSYSGLPYPRAIRIRG